MKELIIDFRTNYQNCDYNEKLYAKCKTAEELDTVRIQINSYLLLKISQCKDGEKDEV